MTTLLEQKQDQTCNMIAVMAAYTNGKKILARYAGSETWHVIVYPSWDWVNFDYKVAEE